MRNTIFIILTLISMLTGQIYAYAEEPFRLEAKENGFQFPFFEQQTPVWSYNGQIPGPVIRGREGTTLEVDFLNSLDEPTSVHWHGLRIDNAMDGVPGVTQAPVGTGENFLYRLKLEDAGTFWYHPHFNSSEQLERGLKGVLIVEETEKQLWSQDLVWLLDDWLLQKDGSIYPHFNTRHDLMHDGRWGNAPTINGKYRPEFTPPTEAEFIPAQMFERVAVSKIWDLNAIRGGKYGIGWAMNIQLWPDADKVDYSLGVPRKIVFQNSSSRLHPMHIHGVFFRVLERNGQKAVEPFTRDTVLVGPRESVTIGSLPEHPGIWLTHCHIQSHAEAGMMTTIEVKK